MPIYVINDRRIRKAIFRALIRWRYYRTEELNEVEARNLEKWSIVIVSNSLRSNLTGMLSQVRPSLTRFLEAWRLTQAKVPEIRCSLQLMLSV